MTVFWDVTLCSLVKAGHHLKGAYYIHHQITLMIGQVDMSETTYHFLQDYTEQHPKT
jgi:hypothetical protein